MTATIRIDNLINVPGRKLDAIVNQKLEQLEQLGIAVTEIQYFPRPYEIKGPAGTQPDRYQSYDVIIQWVNVKQ